jgi:low affinity Fe/Cu permease
MDNEKKNVKPKKGFFHCFAKIASDIVGNAWTFFCFFILVFIWFLVGPIFQFSDTWQLVINTFTSVITFLIVFLIQNTQNRDTEDIKIKLDELIRANKRARNSIIDLEKLSDKDLKKLEEHYKKISPDISE